MRQILFCVESNKQACTDSMYIDKTIKSFFEIDNEISINYIYMNGKSRYKDNKILKEIRNYIKTAENRKISTTVIYCIDTDNYDTVPEDCQLNKEIKAFCKRNNYELVWFCRTIEEVFLHRIVDSSKKVIEAKNFVIKQNFDYSISPNLSNSNNSRKKSNLLLIVDKYLNRKSNK